MNSLLFGTAGIPRSTPTKTTVDGIERTAELGLGCMELEFVQGVRMGEAGARLVAEAAARTGIRLSVHGPYYINLNAHEPEKIRASQDRIYQSCRIGALCGAVSVIFHAAFYLGDPPDKVYDRVKGYLAEIVGQLERDNIEIRLRPELTGKGTQFGNLDELLSLSTELAGVSPCIDFAHLHARTGGFNTYADFASVLETIGERLGEAALGDMHIHLSGIEYGDKGERRHLDMAYADMNYRELLRALVDYNAGGRLVCESPNLEEDALLLLQTYRELGGR